MGAGEWGAGVRAGWDNVAKAGMTDSEVKARRDERAAIVGWIRQEAARYRRLEPVLSPAARALEATAHLIETHAWWRTCGRWPMRRRRM